MGTLGALPVCCSMAVMMMVPKLKEPPSPVVLKVPLLSFSIYDIVVITGPSDQTSYTLFLGHMAFFFFPVEHR